MIQRIIEFLHDKVDANTKATLFITILVFGLGLFFAWIGKQVKDYKNRQLYKSSIIHILKDFNISCKKQQDIVSRSLEKASLIQGNDFNVNYVPIGTLEFLNRIDLTVLVQNLSQTFWGRTFCKSNNSKAISKLIELISQVKVSNEQIKTLNATYFESYQKHESRFYSSLDDLRKINDEFSVMYKSGNLLNSEITYVQGYCGIFVKWADNGASNIIFNLRNEIVLKILKYNKEFTGNPHVLRTNNLCLVADHSFSTIEKVDELLFKMYRGYIRAHKRAGKLTDVIVRIIE